jgi:hypothetical protein
MEYYNSQPVKAPSNILERYIKRKKWSCWTITTGTRRLETAVGLEASEVGLIFI